MFWNGGSTLVSRGLLIEASVCNFKQINGISYNELSSSASVIFIVQSQGCEFGTMVLQKAPDSLNLAPRLKIWCQRQGQ